MEGFYINKMADFIQIYPKCNQNSYRRERKPHSPDGGMDEIIVHVATNCVIWLQVNIQRPLRLFFFVCVCVNKLKLCFCFLCCFFVVVLSREIIHQCFENMISFFW